MARPRNSSGVAADTAVASSPPDDMAAVTGRHIRGSSLLLTGRGLALGIKLIAQLLMVRYLSTADYGVWAQVLAVITLLGAFSSLSLDRGLTRFASIFHERAQYGRFFGALLLVTGAILISAILFAVVVYGFPERVQALLGGRGDSLALLFILLFLVPLEGLDQVCIATFATLGRAGTIFFRKYLLGPALQLAAVLLMLLLRADVMFLGAAYLAATFTGVLINSVLLLRMFRRDGLLAQFRIGTLDVPVRPMFAFALPLMTSDWLAVLVQSSGALMLGYLAGAEPVALFRVVVPLALLSQVVVRSFDVLYVPTAARLYAAGRRDDIAFLYRRTAFWVAVIAFPIFAFTFTAATPLTVLLYGARYESSGAVLAVLALGTYVKTALSFSGATLKVLGDVRAVAGTNLIAACANVLLNVLLVPRFGVMGAATAMSGTMLLDAVLKHEALRRRAGFSIVGGPERRLRGALLAFVAALIAVRGSTLDDPLLLGFLAAASSAAVFMLSRSTLGVDDVFPQLRRTPLARLMAR